MRRRRAAIYALSLARCGSLAMVAAALPGGCGNGTPPNATAPTITDPMQACMAWCEIVVAKGCYEFACTDYCKDRLFDAGSACVDLFLDGYVCAAEEAPSRQDCLIGCPAFSALWDCKLEAGCYDTFDSCLYHHTAPGGEDTCQCSRQCAKVSYTSRCWTDGTVSTCDCFADTTTLAPDPTNWVGTCQDGPTAACSLRVEKSCCNQFFKL